MTQGPSWWHVHHSAKMDSSVRVSGRLAGYIISSLHLLAPPKLFWAGFTRDTMGGHVLPPSAPPEFSQLVFSGSTSFFTRTFCCETTQASIYHPAWPSWAVLVNGSLTRLTIKQEGRLYVLRSHRKGDS